MASGANGQSFAFKAHLCRLKKTSGFRLFGLWNSVRASAADADFIDIYRNDALLAGGEETSS